MSQSMSQRAEAEGGVDAEEVAADVAGAGRERQQQQKRRGSFHGRVGGSSARVGARYLDPHGAAMLDSHASDVMGESWMVAVAQPGRAPDCGSGCRGFKSRRSPHPSTGLAFPDVRGWFASRPKRKLARR